LGLRRRGDLDLLLLLGSGDLDLDLDLELEPELDLDLELDRFVLMGSGLSRSDLGLEIDRDLSDLLLDRDFDLAFLGGLLDCEGLELGEGSLRFFARVLPRPPLLLSYRCLLLPWESSEVASSELGLEGWAEFSSDFLLSSLFFPGNRRGGSLVATSLGS
jgi:hypothetical protein